MTDQRIYQIANEYLNASGKVPTIEDLQAMPFVFDRWRELTPRTLGRNEKHLRHYLTEIRRWSISNKKLTRCPKSIFE